MGGRLWIAGIAAVAFAIGGAASAPWGTGGLMSAQALTQAE